MEEKIMCGFPGDRVRKSGPSVSHVDVFGEGDEDVVGLADDGAAHPVPLFVLLDEVHEPVYGATRGEGTHQVRTIVRLEFGAQ